MKRVRELAGSGRHKLREYVQAVVIPNLQANGRSKSHLERYAAAVEYALRCARRPVAPREIDEQFILEFDAWLWRQNISDGRRRDLVEALRNIGKPFQPGPGRFVHRRQRRPLPKPKPGTNRHFYETVDVPQRLAGRSADYIEDGRTVFYRLYEHFGRDLQLREQTDAIAAEHVAWLVEMGLSSAAVNRHLAVWFASWRHAHKSGLVGFLPTLKKLPRNEDAPDAWSPAEIALLLSNADAAADKPIAGCSAGDYWRALIYVVWYTGIRRRAVMGLRQGDVELQTGWLRVPGELMKNRRGKPFRLGLDAIDALRKVWEPRRELVFEFGFDKTTFYKQFRRIINAAGVPRGTSNAGCLHKLRRSCATAIAAAQGMGAAQSILGHRSMAVTERYIDASKMPGMDFTNVLPTLRSSAAAAG